MPETLAVGIIVFLVLTFTVQKIKEHSRHEETEEEFYARQY